MVVFNLARKLAAEGLEQYVFCRNPGDDLQAALEAAGIPVITPRRYVGMAGIFGTARKVADLVQREGIDLVHAHMADAALIAGLASRRTGRPFVITHHGHEIVPACGFPCEPIFSVLLRRAASRTCFNVGVAESVVEVILRRLRAERDRTGLIVNGVFAPDWRQRETPARDAPVLVVVGRLIELKGQSAGAGRITRSRRQCRFPRKCRQRTRLSPAGRRLRFLVASRGDPGCNAGSHGLAAAGGSLRRGRQ